MDATYIFLCGVVWARYGEEPAGLELIRATHSSDTELRLLARSLLQQAGDQSKVLIGKALSRGEMSMVQARLCVFDQAQRFQLNLVERGDWHCLTAKGE